MLPQLTETNVPIYTLEQTSRDGSKDFEIAQTTGLMHHQQELFFVPHRKGFYLFVFVKAGSSRHWVDMVPHIVKPDTLYFSSPHQVILKEDIPAGTTFEGTSICFTQEFLDIEEDGMLGKLPIIQNPHNGHALSLSAADVVFVEDISAKLLAEYNHKQGWHNSMLLAYLRVLLIYLSRLYNEQFTAPDKSPDRELFNRFKGLVSNHFTKYHDVATYAEMLNLSAGHFGELIKKQSGRTPIEHIHDHLLLEAKRMLFHTEASMKEIAFELGFEEASYFNRFFKRLTSTTPLSYRSSTREMYH